MKKQELNVSGRHVVAYLPENAGAVPAVYIHASENDPEQVMPILDGLQAAFIWVQGAKWERDLTPWSAPKAFMRGEDFTGGADDYLKLLTWEIVPDTERRLGIIPGVRALAGYSLGGLFALYAMYKTEMFPLVASVSGSLWYDGWIEFMRKQQKTAKFVYLGLGRGEPAVKNMRFSKVGMCTEEAAKILRESGAEVVFEWSEGTHAKYVHERIAKGLRAVTKNAG